MPSGMLEQLRQGGLAGSKRLTLSASLSEFPREIFQLADTLEVLDLSGNKLSSLPDDLSRLHKLRILFCSNNQFTELPEVLGQCAELEMVGFKSNQISYVPAAALPTRLRWLILTDNRVETLPASIGRCGRLQKLMLAGNRLRDLPPEMAACTNLELVRIAANRFEALPDWLLELPRLAWLAYGGNPFSEVYEQQAREGSEAPDIAWGELALGEKLGEGASGHIHQALWHPAKDASRAVAVKLFKGAVTSDGLPDSEMAACIHAGAHPNLIAVHGKVSGHPKNAHGLVMALVQSEFRTLAGPPSLESCTRDIYAPELRFAPATAVRMALGIAQAIMHMHMHVRGITHGDLYAHNILHDGNGNVLLGDCGAASFIPPQAGIQALALQRIELRAFGCLLEELLDRSEWRPEQEAARAALLQLRSLCLQEQPAKRPLFAEVAVLLHGQLERLDSVQSAEK